MVPFDRFSPDYVFQISISEKLIFANNALLELADISSIQDGSLSSWHSKEQLEQFACDIKPKILETGQWVGDFGLVDQKGRLLPCQFLGISHRNHSGDIEYITGIFHEVANCQNRLTSLDPNLEESNRTSITSRNSYWCWETTASDVVCSGSFSKLLGYSPKQSRWALTRFWNRLHPDDMVHTKKVFYDHLEKNKTPFTIVHRWKCKDGSYRWLQCSGCAFYDDKGEPVRLFGVISDIQRQKEKDSKIELKQLNDRLSESLGELRLDNVRLKEKNAQLQQFFYLVSHNLKSPLFSISGFLNRLIQSREISGDPRLLHATDRIRLNIKIMTQTLHSLLQFSYFTQPNVETEPIKLTEVLETVLISLEAIIATSKACIECNFQSDQFEGQFSMIVQVFSNLINNSIKYRQENSIPRIKILSTSTGNQVTIRYEDNGLGIPQTKIEKVFQLFERFHPERAEGSGVGLAIIKAIIENHRGMITFQSTEGKGTIFTIILPKKQEHQMLDQKKKENSD